MATTGYAKYLNFKYYFPPRPEYMVQADKLSTYEEKYFAQPKLNGSCCEIYIKGDEVKNFGRHQNEKLTGFKLKIDDLRVLNCGNDNWNVIVGEYMNKSQTGLDGKVWNHKFVIFDILVYNGEYLLGSTFEERVALMDELFGTVEENEYLYKINDNVYRVKTFYDKFLERWNEIVKIGMLEGLVMKKKEAKLERGLSESNMKLYMAKCRKETKLYKF
jgi:hypothetical protein